jgi:integrase
LAALRRSFNLTVKANRLPASAKPSISTPDPTVVRPRLLGRTPHFRRTAARNLIRAGVPQHVVTKLCGWKTDAMFHRYAIVDERDLRDAVELLAKGDNRGTI